MSNPRWFFVKKYGPLCVELMCKVSRFYRKVHDALASLLEHSQASIVATGPDPSLAVENIGTAHMSMAQSRSRSKPIVQKKSVLALC